MDPLLQTAAQYSPALVAGVGVTLFSIITLLRFFGFTAIGDKSKLVDEDKLSSVSSDLATISANLTKIEMRLTAVERDLPTRATHDDVHKLALRQAEMGGDIKAMNATMNAAANAIARMEEGVYEAARRFGQREAELSDREADLRRREIRSGRRDAKGAGNV